MSEQLVWSEHGKEWPHRSASQFVSAGGMTWHVQRFGGGQRVLLIHGTAASTHSWAGLVDCLKSEHEIVSLDLPGHAFSEAIPAREMSLSGIGLRIADLLRVLHFEPTIIVGHSAGAAIAIRMMLDASIAPPRRIVSLNGALLPFSGMAGWLFPVLAKILVTGPFAADLFAWRARSPGAVARIVRSTGSEIKPCQLKFYERLMRCRGHVRAALDMMAHWDLEQLARDLPRLAVPLTLVTGSVDLAVPPEVVFRTRDILPSAEIKLELGLGHLAHEESPERIAVIVRSALE